MVLPEYVTECNDSLITARVLNIGYKELNIPANKDKL
jgi:hypothetical protein